MNVKRIYKPVQISHERSLHTNKIFWLPVSGTGY